MTDTQEVQTKYGTVEVETVDCDSCGTTVGKEEAHRFAMTEQLGVDSVNPRFNQASRSGYACKHCVDNGPVSFLERDYSAELDGDDWVLIVAIVCSTLLIAAKVVV